MKPISKISRFALICSGVAMVGLWAYWMYVYVNKVAQKKTDADMKRQQDKVESMTRREREFYETILMEFHRRNISDKIIKRELKNKKQTEKQKKWR